MLNRRIFLAGSTAAMVTACRTWIGSTSASGTHADGSSTVVSTSTDLQSALDDGIMDITLDAAVNAPSGGINIPRTAGRRVLRCTNRGILNRGADHGHVLRSDGRGGRLHLIGFRVDGGWRTRLFEQPDDARSNFFLPDYDELRIEGCVTCYSLRTGYLVTGSREVQIVGSTLFACPRDHVWADGVRDLLVEDCLVQHCGDDSLGAHQHAGQGLITQSIIFRRNTVRDSLGGKLHAGAADGTYNGKVSRILYEDNLFDACGLYGIHGHEPPSWQKHNTSEPRNIIIRNNTVRNLRRTTPVSPDQTIGVVWRFSFPGFSFDRTMQIVGNTMERVPSAHGKRLQDVVHWQTPENVPGAGSFEGFYTKTGFDPDATFDLADQGALFRGSNVEAIVHEGNQWIGSGWAEVIA